MIHSLLSNSLQGIDADGVLDSLTGLESSDMMGILDDLMNPIKIHLHYTEKTDSDSDKIIKDIKVHRMYSSENPPHDIGLHTKELQDLKDSLNKNYPIEKFPELWV